MTVPSSTLPSEMGSKLPVPKNTPLVYLKLYFKTLGLGNLRPITLMGLSIQILPQHQLQNGHTWTEFGTFNFQILTSLDKISQGLKSYLQVSFLSSLLSFDLPIWTSKHNSLIFPHPGTGLVASLRNVIFRDLYSLSLNSLILWEMFPPVILAALSAAYGPSFLDLRPWNSFPHFFILLFCAYLPRP